MPERTQPPEGAFVPVLFADAIERSLRDVQPYRIEGEPVAVLADVLDPYRVSLDD